MKITVNEITGKTYEQMNTELLFFIASAKTRGFELIRLEVSPVGDEKREEVRSRSLSKLLAKAKRSGFLELYILTENLTGNSTEAEYLRNKYPEIVNQDDGNASYIIKLQH